jgi:hypothetical protein
VQALLAPELPGIQCYPVGQPDGGRDAMVDNHRESPGRLILQVKFKRRDDRFDDTAKWLIDALTPEQTKIRRLAERGATQYIVVTNAEGTSHLDAGSMDRVESWLKENIPIPAKCLWRTDLDRRFENAHALKWVYPELLSGPDGLRLALESSLHHHGARRAKAVRAFVAEQYDRDLLVRFKQVELKNDLFPLFIDVPITIQTQARKPSTRERSFLMFAALAKSATMQTTQLVLPADLDPTSDAFLLYRRLEVPRMGAASFLLWAPTAEEEFAKVVVEGAPGQGKSTLAQYVGQILRCRFLDRLGDLRGLPSDHLSAPARLPFKIDFRDLATWLTKRNPFNAEDDTPPDDWQPSLESFLASMIHQLSGGLAFEVIDLIETLEAAPTTLIFDGLDEVADIKLRARVVETVNRGLRRLEAQGAGLQVVITTRPAAFANSPGFSRRGFAYFTLVDIERNMILDYTDRWIRAKDLIEADAQDLRTILIDKLSTPHIRDLARNAMQLAILLSVIHSVGHSLPDKRTALYDTYLDKFLTREAEKTAAVKRYRPLLIRLHQHIAWILHSEAERGRSSGSLTLEELRREITSYLEEHGHVLDILDALFTGVLERVGVLVQRIEGLYEFEVQPIREYFAAGYLYHTAPPSRQGQEREGTISHRFEALASNRYWTNVVRFYAGYYSSGELADLLIHLKAMKEASTEVSPLHVRELASMLLRDWVFNQSPRVQAEVAQVVFDQLGIRGAAQGFTEDSYTVNETALNFPSECGGGSLTPILLELLDEDARPAALELEICRIVKSNLTESIEPHMIERAQASSDNDRTRWIRIAASSGAISFSAWKDHFGSDLPSEDQYSERLQWCARAQIDLLEGDLDLARGLIRVVLRKGRALGLYINRSNSWLGCLASLLTASEAFQQFPRGSYYSPTLPPASLDWREAREALSVAANLFGTPSPWRESLEPWCNWIECIRVLFGEEWAVFDWAALAASIPVAAERGRGFRKLFEDDAPLCHRARHARMRRSDVAWWLAQAREARTPPQMMFWIVMSLTWLKRSDVADVRRQLELFLEQLTKDEYETVFHAMDDITRYQGPPRDGLSRMAKHRIGGRLMGLALANMTTVASEYTPSRLRKLKESDPILQKRARTIEMRRKWPDGPSAAQWPAALRQVSEAFKSGELVRSPFLRRIKDSPSPMPIRAALEVLARPFEYPFDIVRLADYSIRSREAIAPVADIAAAQGWTFM